MSNPGHISTAIIGAGPFGLSIAAHLREGAVPFRIFGFPMHRWLEQMPRGMFLKSEGQASSLSEPSGRFTLARYCADHRIPYGDRGKPVAIETFTKYALAFQRRFVPDVEQVYISRLERHSEGFLLTLKNGSELIARNVVVATGLEDTVDMPPVFRNLPAAQVSHSSEHSDLDRFRGRDVTVIGAGQSAIETAAILYESGADVRLIARGKTLEWNTPPADVNRSLYHRLRYPVTNLGEGLRMLLYDDFPNLYRYLPLAYRISQVKHVLGPAGAWWLRDRFEGKVNVMTGSDVVKAECHPEAVRISVRGPDSTISELFTDHVIVATGYQYDLNRISFLSDDLRKAIRTENLRPDLSPNFESSVPGLYFAGVASAYRFGPSMRFIAGVDFAARTLAPHLARKTISDILSTARIPAMSR